MFARARPVPDGAVRPDAGDVDRNPVGITQTDDGAFPAECRTTVPARLEPVGQRLVAGPAVEADDPVRARLGAGVIPMPDHALAVGRDPATGDSNGVVGDAPSPARRTVPGVELRAPAFGRGVDETVGCVTRPMRKP